MKKIFFALCLCTLFAACSKDDSSSGGNGGGNGGNGGGGSTPPSTYTVSGVVSGSDGALLKGVVVSDGYTCAVTDASGKYYLNSDLSKADYVFVSTPSTYSAPVESGHAIFWKFYKDESKGSDGKYSISFTLNKISSPERYTVLIFADPQPRSSSANYDKIAYHSLDCCNDMYRDMKEYAATLTGRPVYGIGLGDIVHQNLSLLANYKRGMATVGIANYNISGNHDHDRTKSDDASAIKTYEASLGPANYSFNLGGMHYLMLDNMIAPDASTGVERDVCATGLTDEIWAWVQEDLSYVSKDTPLMVCGHSPMMRLQNGTERSGSHLADLRNLLSKYPKAYVWAGHTHSTHNYVDTSNPTIESHTLTRVTGSLWTNEFLGENGTPRGYTVFEYDNGDIQWKFKPLYYQSGSYVGSTSPDYQYRDWDYVNGKAVLKATGEELDDTYQMQIFPPNLYGDGYLYVNVFLWDELWKKPVFTTEGNPSVMTRVTDNTHMYSYADFDLTSFYITNPLLSSNISISYSECSSIFRTHVEAEHGTGTVSVRDRFGNTHTSSITW